MPGRRRAGGGARPPRLLLMARLPMLVLPHPPGAGPASHAAIAVCTLSSWCAAACSLDAEVFSRVILCGHRRVTGVHLPAKLTHRVTLARAVVAGRQR